MFSRVFGKAKQENNAVATLDKLNEVFPFNFWLFAFSFSPLFHDNLFAYLNWIQLFDLNEL